MKTLPTEFNKNGIHYRIIERSANRYFAELSDLESKVIIAYETGRIMKAKSREVMLAGKTTNFEAAEHIINNERFGEDKFEGALSVKCKELAFNNYKDGILYDMEKAKILPAEQNKGYGKVEEIEVIPNCNSKKMTATFTQLTLDFNFT